eukprot:4376911-Amphidinium_carterae.1
MEATHGIDKLRDVLQRSELLKQCVAYTCARSQVWSADLPILKPSETALGTWGAIVLCFHVLRPAEDVDLSEQAQREATWRVTRLQWSMAYISLENVDVEQRVQCCLPGCCHRCSTS